MAAPRAAASAAAQLAVIADLAGRARRVGAELWLSGGWAMDFFLDRVTRVHENIDVFTLDTALAALDAAVRGAGYRPVSGPPPAQLRAAGWGRIGDDRMRYIAPAAQVEIKAMTPVWAPSRPGREKDARDIVAITRELARRP